MAAFRPDVVLLDIGLPDMDGYEIARRFRRQPGLERIALAALTGWGQEEDRLRTRAAGFDHHFIKPIDVDALRAWLASLDPALEGSRHHQLVRRFSNSLTFW